MASKRARFGWSCSSDGGESTETSRVSSRACRTIDAMRSAQAAPPSRRAPMAKNPPDVPGQPAAGLQARRAHGPSGAAWPHAWLRRSSLAVHADPQHGGGREAVRVRRISPAQTADGVRTRRRKAFWENELQRALESMLPPSPSRPRPGHVHRADRRCRTPEGGGRSLFATSLAGARVGRCPICPIHARFVPDSGFCGRWHRFVPGSRGSPSLPDPCLPSAWPLR